MISAKDMFIELRAGEAEEEYWLYPCHFNLSEKIHIAGRDRIKTRSKIKNRIKN